MLRSSKKILCAWMSLMLEKHKASTPFSLKEVLYTREELHERAEKMFENKFSDYVVKQITAGEVLSESDKFLVRLSGSSLKTYLRLACPEELSSYDLDELISGLKGSTWWSTAPYTENNLILAIMDEYYSFIRGLSLPVQGENNQIITREAIWMATATMTYNDYVRTGSTDIRTYQYSQSAISSLAINFNSRMSEDSCRTMVREICTAGQGRQPWAYLVDMGGMRRDNRKRLAYYGEYEYSQPETLHYDFKVATITCFLTIKELSDFISRKYSPIFYKQLVPPLDDTYSQDDKERQALEMDYESLRAAAGTRGTYRPRLLEAVSKQYVRDPYIMLYAKRRANGICQLCGSNAPFMNNAGEPFLEVHHIQWLSRGGADAVTNVVALCPNCHRKMHIVDNAEDVKKLNKAVNGDG